MTIELPPILARFVEAKMSSGQFASPQEVILEALEMLKEKDEWYAHRIERLQQDIEAGLNSGEPIHWQANHFAQRLINRHEHS